MRLKLLSTAKKAARSITKEKTPARVVKAVKRAKRAAAPDLKLGREVVVNKVKRVDPAARTASVLQTRIHEILSYNKSLVQARRGSYRAAMNPRSRNQTPFGGSGDQHVDPWSRRMMRELARDMDRNADTFGVLHDAFAAAVIGEGVKYRPTTANTAWNKIAAEKMHELLSRDVGGIDCTGRRTGYRLGYDVVRAFAVDGESGVIELDNYTVQPFESEQITNGGTLEEGVMDGVKSLPSGEIVAFHIVPYDDLGRLRMDGGQEFEALNVRWLANRSRFSQTRGVPMLIAGLDDWERLDSFRESEVIAAEQGSQIYGAIEHVEGDLGTNRPFASSTVDRSNVLRSGLTDSTSENGIQVDWQPTVAGAIMDLPDGKHYVPIDPQRPNPNAVPFMMEMIRQFCAKAGIPYEWAYNDVRGLSWSVNRALVQMARDRIAIWQTQCFAPFFSRLYVWLLGGLIEAGVLPDPGDDWAQHELQWSKISWPDEGQEYDAQGVGLLKGLTTRHRVHGPLWRDFLDERAEELEYASVLAEAHNQKHKDFPVTPQFFLGFENEVSQSKSETKSDTTTEDLTPGGDKAPAKAPKKEQP